MGRGAALFRQGFNHMSLRSSPRLGEKHGMNRYDSQQPVLHYLMRARHCFSLLIVYVDAMTAPGEWPSMQLELREHGLALQVSAPRILAALADDAALITDRTKKLHLLRHGQGNHNVAQADWLAAGRPGEPYWVSTDPGFAYLDAELTPLGEQQARDLRLRTANLRPELLISSPMRRALSTGLIAFDDHITGRLDGTPLAVIALEACHEHAGRHTCDKRLSKAELAARYPAVDFSLLEAEEDPFWGDGETRESLESLAHRAASIVAFILARPERHIVVAAHSTVLAALVNAGLTVVPSLPGLQAEDVAAVSIASDGALGTGTDSGEVEAATSWFKTGEIMRTFLVQIPGPP